VSSAFKKHLDVSSDLPWHVAQLIFDQFIKTNGNLVPYFFYLLVLIKVNSLETLAEYKKIE